MTKTLSIFGATGTVGRKAAQVVAADPSAFCVEVLTAAQDVAGLVGLGGELQAAHLVLSDAGRYQELRDAVHAAGLSCSVAAGGDAMLEAAARPVDCAVSAVVGLAGLPTTLALAAHAKVLAVANKESVVCGWPLLREQAARCQTQLIPLDSEHNSLFQLLEHLPKTMWSGVTITASGGPFRGMDRQALAGVTPAQALRHPIWRMGSKISVDSATLANKGLEVMEAACLFALSADQIQVLVHPQAQVHAMVRLRNGSRLSLSSPPDMLYPMQQALYWPQPFQAPAAQGDWCPEGVWEFLPVDDSAFPAVRLAYQALRAGQGAMVAYNVANEVAVAAFLQGQLSFLGISQMIEAAMEMALADFPLASLASLHYIQEYDQWLRQRLGGSLQPTLTALTG
jgi:1-deoxy-D-xylulose-5-phosphate reductoisomerase